MGGGFADVALAREDLEQEIRDQVHQAFEGMMHALYRQEGAMLEVEIIQEPEVTDFISTHAGVLNQAMQRAPLSDAMRHRLERSNFIFSGFKTYHELNEAFPSLIDENGERKPFERFLNDVLAIDSTYNRNYLRAEYNFCQASADMAAKWEQIEADGDRYNLQYRTQHDDKVRPEHAALDGVTLPPSDPFWESYYPPNGWNCRCTVAQVRKSKYPVTDPEEARARGEEALQRDTRGIFRFNSGKQGKTFPDYNPYTISRCRDCDIAQGKVNLAFVPENEFCAACRLIHQAQATRVKKKLTPQEFKDAISKANQWADANLTPVIIDGKPSKRTTVITADGHDIFVGKKFFTETAAKGKRDPELAHLLKTATEFGEWLPLATLDRIEAGVDHAFQFSVYKVSYQGQTIECKCKMTTGEILYTMRIL